MPDISKEESDIVGLALLKSKVYVILNEKRFDQQIIQDFQTTMNLAMQAMQGVSKKMKDKPVPSGGSSSAMCEEDKIKDLFQSFSLRR